MEELNKELTQMVNVKQLKEKQRLEKALQQLRVFLKLIFVSPHLSHTMYRLMDMLARGDGNKIAVRALNEEFPLDQAERHGLRAVMSTLEKLGLAETVVEVPLDQPGIKGELYFRVRYADNDEEHTEEYIF